jgi:hypothetical protein
MNPIGVYRSGDDMIAAANPFKAPRHASTYKIQTMEVSAQSYTLGWTAKHGEGNIVVSRTGNNRGRGYRCNRNTACC